MLRGRRAALPGEGKAGERVGAAGLPRPAGGAVGSGGGDGSARLRRRGQRSSKRCADPWARCGAPRQGAELLGAVRSPGRGAERPERILEVDAAGGARLVRALQADTVPCGVSATPGWSHACFSYH